MADRHNSLRGGVSVTLVMGTRAGGGPFLKCALVLAAYAYAPRQDVLVAIKGWVDGGVRRIAQNPCVSCIG